MRAIAAAIVGTFFLTLVSIYLYLATHTVTRIEYFKNEVSAEERRYYKMVIHCLDWHIFWFFIVDLDIESQTATSAVIIVKTIFSYPVVKVVVLDIKGNYIFKCHVIGTDRYTSEAKAGNKKGLTEHAVHKKWH